MQINWFSPLQVERTDIAHYTARLLPALAARCTVTLWTDEPTWDRALERYARVRQFSPTHLPWEAMNGADLNVYQIGNNAACHGAIWDVSRRLPGIVVLHDYNLQDFFIRYCEARDHQEHVAYMARVHGRAAADAARRCWEGQMPFGRLAERYPLTALATENALAVIVHTDGALSAVRRCTDSPVVCTPLPFPAIERSNTRTPGPPYRLILFGYIGKNRRLRAVLHALAGMSQRDAFRLDVFGQLWNADEAHEIIDALGLQKLVHLHGFVPENELDAALDAAHLAINLRHPTMGEASGSQLRLWDHALPSLVTPVGWYGSLPPSTVLFVRADNEIRDIQAHLLALMERPAELAEQGRAGRRLLEAEHSPQKYAESIVRLAETVQRRRRQLLAGHLAARVGGELATFLSGRESEASYRHVAEEIHRLAS